jgi:hypothetical protein
MADQRRLIDGWINTSTSKRRNLKNSVFYEPLAIDLYWSQQILFRFVLLLDDAVTEFTPPAGTTWYYGMDSVYTEGHVDIVQVFNADFIEADWSGTDGADFENGRVCWRVDLTGAALKTDLGTAASKAYHCGLWMTPPGEKTVCLSEWDMTVYNLATSQVSPVNMPGIVYVDTDMLEPYLRKKEPNCPLWYNEADQKTYMYNPDDSLWYAVGLRTKDGVAAFTVAETGVAL